MKECFCKSNNLQNPFFKLKEGDVTTSRDLNISVLDFLTLQTTQIVVFIKISEIKYN